MLRSYFRQFGAIDWVRILPGCYRNCRKSFAYVTFVNCLGAYEALNTDGHEIKNDKLIVEQAFSWHQSGIEDAVPPSFSHREIELYSEMNNSLNDDCIINIMSFLNIVELISMASYNQRFLLCAHQQRTMKIIPEAVMDDGWTLMHLRRILRLLGFGHAVKHLILSSKVFRLSQKSHLYGRLVQYIGPQLTTLSLRYFNVRSDEFDQLKPLLQQLQCLEIDLNYEFDYEKLNDNWPNLEILRLRSSGLIQLKKDATKVAFPKLSSLQLITGYKLHENLFDTIATNFAGINDLVIIMLDDYYSELTQVAAPTDFRNLINIQNLTNLHLSITSTYYNEVVIIEEIAKVTTLTNLTLDITNTNPESQISITDYNLTLLVRNLQNLISFRLSGLHITTEKIMLILQNLPDLNEFGIHNCNYSVNMTLLNNIAIIRRKQQANRCMLLQGNLLPIRQLIITVDECFGADYNMDEVISGVSNFV